MTSFLSVTSPRRLFGIQHTVRKFPGELSTFSLDPYDAKRQRGSQTLYELSATLRLAGCLRARQLRLTLSTVHVNDFAQIFSRRRHRCRQATADVGRRSYRQRCHL